MINKKRSNLVAWVTIWFFGGVLAVVGLVTMYQNGYDYGYEKARRDYQTVITDAQ